MSDRIERATPENATESLRRFLFALFGFGAVSTAMDLLLLGHTEDRKQLIPLLLLGLSAGLLIVVAVRPRRGYIRVFRVLMVLVAASGALGVYLHYQSNAEFELEMYPSLGGAELMWESLRGAIPALAPGTMTLLGVLGLLSTYKHPHAKEN